MPVRPDQLRGRLDKGPEPVYLVAGDEPLLVEECADAIRAAAREAGYGDREVLDVGPGFDWDRLAAGGAGPSLFASKQLLEMKLPGGKPGNEGSKAIQDWVGANHQDILLLVVAHDFDHGQARNKWVKALDKAGCFVHVYPLTPDRLPRWIAERMRRRGLSPTRDAVKLLAERTEGNLLAADQEIEKLALLVDDAKIDEAAVLDAVADSARFQAFGMIDAALAGDAARAIRSLRGLRAEGTEPVVVMGAVVWQLNQLARIAVNARQKGLDAAFREARVWPKKQAVLEPALKRHAASVWPAFVEQAALIDRQSKGRAAGDAWITLEQLLLVLAGARAVGGWAGRHGRKLETNRPV